MSRRVDTDGRVHKVTVTMDREELSKLRSLAKVEKRSLADTIRTVIDRELGRKA